MRLSRRLHDLVGRHAELEALSQHLSIATFRYVPLDVRDTTDPEAQKYISRLNQELLSRIERSGELFLSGATVNGHFALRACIVNFRTTEADVDAIPAVIARVGREVDTQLRGVAASAAAADLTRRS